MLGLIAELRRRSVFRVAAAYLVVAWLIMQVVATIGTAAGLPGWADSLALVLLLAGFPVILFIAWAFELSPDGLKRTEAADGDGTEVRAVGLPDFALIGALAVVGMIAVSQMLTRPDSTQQLTPLAAATSQAPNEISPSSIAVLPFLDLSPDGDQQYFSDGISEEILNVLVRVDGLEVTSRTSAFQYRSDALSIREIADRLRVRHVLEGSVRRAGDSIRITAQLIDAQTDVHLWSQTYDQSLTAQNLFAIQDEIANAIVRALSDVLDVDPPSISISAPTDDVAAYDLFLQARALFQRRADLDTAVALTARAVEQAPDFTEAWALRASIANILTGYGFVPEDLGAHQDLIESYARQTLALDSENSTAIAVLAQLRFRRATVDGQHDNIADIIAEFERAIEIDRRNATAYNWVGLTRLTVGDLDGALADFQTCLQLEARYAPCAENRYDTLAALGRTRESLAVFEASLTNGLSTGHGANYGVLADQGERLAFLLQATRASALPDFPRLGDIYDAYLTPDADHSDLVHEALEYMPPESRDHSADALSLLLTPLGAEGLPVPVFAIWKPEFERYRQSEPFSDMIRTSGVFDYWREHGFPDLCRPVGSEDFACD